MRQIINRMETERHLIVSKKESTIMPIAICHGVTPIHYLMTVTLGLMWGTKEAG